MQDLLKVLYTIANRVVCFIDNIPRSAPPPTIPPDAIVSTLTQDHQIPIEYYYVDDSNKGQGIDLAFQLNYL